MCFLLQDIQIIVKPVSQKGAIDETKIIYLFISFKPLIRGTKFIDASHHPLSVWTNAGVFCVFFLWCGFLFS